MSTLNPPQAFAPPRSFQDSPPQVESPTSPGRGTVRNRQTSSPGADVERPDISGAAMPGPSSQETPRMIVSFQMAGADVGP